MSQRKQRPLDARGTAVQVLVQVLDQRRSLSEALEAGLRPLEDRRERALAQTLCYGVMRSLPRLQAYLDALLDKGLKAKDIDVEATLLIGLVQLLELRIPEHAAVAATVETGRALGKAWSAGLINAVLRNFLRQREQLDMQLQKRPSAIHAHPNWMLRRLQQDWPEDWEAICAANNQQAPMHLRVNARQHSREAYLDLLQAEGIEAQLSPETEQGITLTKAVDVSALPGFDTGAVSVQDLAAQLAAQCLDTPPGAKVLDACAAPGGKTAHILEREPSAEVWALDNDPQRVERLNNTLTRLQLSATVRCAEAGDLEQWWDGQAFARILLDAPCSASGVIRRHPDIKYLRQANDIAALAQRQADLLDQLWPCLASGGILLYATCSVFAMENSQQLAAFLARHADAKEVPISANWGRACQIGRQILPAQDQMDGFYYARLQKV